MDLGQLGDIHATRRAAGGARLRPALGGGWILVLWGSLWLAGSLLQLAGSPWVAPFWTAAVPLGIACSFWLGVRMKQFVRAHWGFGGVRIEKGFVGRRPRTWVQLTDRGQQATQQHLQALERLVKGARPQRRRP